MSKISVWKKTAMRRRRCPWRTCLAVLLVVLYIANIVRVHNQQQQPPPEQPMEASFRTNRRDGFDVPDRTTATTAMTTTTTTTTTIMTFYSRTRGDRPGSAILDRLMAHAFVYFQQQTANAKHHNHNQSWLTTTTTIRTIYRYGGACGGSDSFITLPNQQRLIQTLGLEQELAFHASCPTTNEEQYCLPVLSSSSSSSSDIPNTSTNTSAMAAVAAAAPSQNQQPSSSFCSSKVLEYNDYAAISVTRQTFTLSWIQSLRRARSLRLAALQQREEQEPQQRPQQQQKNCLQLVVHVRRGDVTLCGNRYKRYFANRYYLALIDHYIKKNNHLSHPSQTNNNRCCNISIFSNFEDPQAHNAMEPREPWSDFTNRGYHVFLGTDLSLTWQTFVTADVLMLSKSAFSHVPAMFNTHGTVIYSPYWVPPLPNWERVPRNVSQERARHYMKEARQKYCPFSDSRSFPKSLHKRKTKL